ncbi:MAG: leucine-rich repeat protein [Candidatus Cryptobacteroides sp.]|nr:leucine-rich repeat protein [Candidatus Cryptobacteroides sp.]
MKTNKLLLSSAVMTALLTGCLQEPDFEPVTADGALAIQLEGSILQEATKVNAAGFEDGDALGLYAVNYTDANQTPGTLLVEGNQADHVKYVFNESAWQWTPVRPVYYKDVNTNVDLYVFYPHAEPGAVDAWNFEVQKDQSTARSQSALGGYEASDFLWAKAENVAPTEAKIKVQLQHKMAGAEVVLQQGDGFAEGEFESVERYILATGTTRKASINLSTGGVTPVGGAQATGIVMCPQVGGSFRAIVVPQTVAAQTPLFSITLGGVPYIFKKETDFTYEAGKISTFTIKVNRKVPSGEFELELADVSISSWKEDINTHESEARQYYVVNVETPGTLGRLIKAAKKNPDKIRNLKVTGQINGKDFHFMRDSMAILEAVNLKEAKVKKAFFTTSYLGSEGSYCDDVIPYNAFYNKTSLVYFAFPETITDIGAQAFRNTNLSGSLILPDDVTKIGDYAFASTNIGSVSFGNKLEILYDYAFSHASSLSCEIHFPSTLKRIGQSAFYYCSLLGKLSLPEDLEYIGRNAFYHSGRFTGDLVIPEKIKILYEHTFECAPFTGTLVLNNVQEFGEDCFNNYPAQMSYSGELVIPEGVIEIPTRCFELCGFSSVIFPSTLRKIGSSCFYQPGLAPSGGKLNGQIVFPEGLVSIGTDAFGNNPDINSIVLPNTFQTLGSNAFKNCYGISNITCSAIEPPTVQSGAFDGVAKDNFTVEVPAQSVKRYQAESGWSDFKRIAAHYDFSVSRERMRALNAAQSRTYTLRAPANFEWAVESKPEWVSVSPESGTGKTDVTITVSEMPRTIETFEVNEGNYNKPSYKQYAGRAGEVVFKLTEKDYTTSFTVEQYDSDYADGGVIALQEATTGPGIDIVFIGDGYDAKDIAKCTFLTNAQKGYSSFFDLEPYNTYKEYFNVYAVTCQSDDSGIGTVNTVIDTKFGSYFTQNRILPPAAGPCFEWAKKANPSMDLTRSLTILLMNTSCYEGVTMMYDDGSAIACCPVSTNAYPYDFRGIVQHEAGGHGFGKLGDEYIYHNAFIQTCNCKDDCDHPSGDNDTKSTYGRMKSKGWFKNLSMSSDNKLVPWSHLIYNPDYSDYVDIYEGGYMHTRGVYRSEATSCMNNNIPYYSAISRQAIVERIKYCAGEEFTLEEFYARDSDVFGSTKAAPAAFDRTFGVDPLWNMGSETGSVIYMGEHPEVK